MKRLPEACCRNGSLPGFSEHRRPYEDTSEPADMLSLSPGTCQRGCRETQRQAFGALARDLMAPQYSRGNESCFCPKTSIGWLSLNQPRTLVWPSMRWLCRLGGESVISHRLSATPLGENLGLGVGDKAHSIQMAISSQRGTVLFGNNRFFQASELTTTFR